MGEEGFLFRLVVPLHNVRATSFPAEQASPHRQTLLSSLCECACIFMFWFEFFNFSVWFGHINYIPLVHIYISVSD